MALFSFWKPIVRDDPLQLEALIRPVVEGLGLELWGLEYRPQKNSALLRVFIDSAEGVSLDDCSNVSEQLSALFDVEDPIPVAYTLEVSSPGLDRVLFEPEHYQRYIGRRLKLRLKFPVDGRRRATGTLESVEAEKIVVDVDGEPFAVPFDAIDRARLVLEVK
ncbi:MAG: ribosome maturation factor RimP [Chromatiales bacterium]|nr:ribosome maturation factor RimP [Chromatiales bacterium]